MNHLQDICDICLYVQAKTIQQISSITPETAKTAAVVLKRLEPLLGCGHTLWMDNFYNSQELARQLNIKHFTNFVSTLKLNGKNVRKEVEVKKMKKEKL